MRLAQWWQKYYCELIALIFTVWGLLLRAQYYLARPISIDETLQRNLTFQPFHALWQRPSFESELTCFQGEFFLNWTFAHVLGRERWMLAAPHVLLTVASFYFLYLICRKYLKTPWGVGIAFAVFCFNQTLVFHGFEIRAYSALIALSLAVFYFTARVVLEHQTLGPIKKILVGFLFIFAIYYHAYGIMLVVFYGVFFYLCKFRDAAWQKNRQGIHRFYAAVAVIGVPMCLWFATGPTPLDYSSWRSPNFITFEYIPNPIFYPVGFAKSIFGNLVGFKAFYFLLAGMIAAFVLPHKDRWQQIGFFLVIVVLPIQLICYSDIYRGYWFLQRQFVWIIALFPFFLGWCWDSVIEFSAKKGKPRPRK